MSLSEAFTNQHMKKWIEGWNTHDIKTVLYMYSENMSSPVPKSKLYFQIVMYLK